jgi:hypothetical protein
MTTRRSFLRGGASAAASVLFCSCGLLHNANAQASRQKLRVMVGGKRVRTIDVHAHCVIPEASKLLGPPAARNTVRGGDEVVIDMAKRLAAMDLAAQVGVGQIVLGSDYPFPWQLQPVDHIFASTSFSDDEKADMLGRTAEKLLNFGP